MSYNSFLVIIKVIINTTASNKNHDKRVEEIMARCKNCKSDLNEEMICPVCKTSVEDETPGAGEPFQVAPPSSKKHKTSIATKWWLWALVAVVVIGGIAAIIVVSVSAVTNEQAAALETTEPFALDAEFTANGLTVFYPSSWNREESASDASIVYIYPPSGGIVMVSSQVTKNTEMTSESEEVEADKYFDQFYEGLIAGSTMTIVVSDERIRGREGDALVERTPVTATFDGADYKGFLYVGIAKGTMASVLALCRADASSGYHETIVNIIDSVEYRSVSPH